MRGQSPKKIYKNGFGLAGKVKHFGDGGSRDRGTGSGDERVS